MELSTVAGIPTILLLGIVALGILLWVAWTAAIDPLVFRLGVRNIPRRRLRGVLVVVGLMLATTVIGSALGTGEAMRYTVRSVITESLGTVDEVIVGAGTPRHERDDRLRALTEPGVASLASVGLPYFPEASATRLSEIEGSANVERIVPAIADQVSVVDPAQRRLTSSMLVLALSPAADQHLADLNPDDVVINQAAAGELNVEAGQELSLLPPLGRWIGSEPDEAWVVHVAAVIEDGGMAGSQPAILVPLERLQERLGREGLINALLVTNRGGVESVDRTDDALEDLRVALVNRDVAARMHEILRSPEALQGLTDAAYTLEGDDRVRVVALREEAERPEPTDRFISLISDPRVRGGLFFLAHDYLSGSEQREVFALLGGVSELSVLPVKQRGVEQADEYGEVVTIVFLVLGLFSVVASVLLIFLTFSLLAADRAAELGTLRAIGMRDRQVMQVFLVEGVAYTVAGALLGALIGVAAAWATTLALARALEPFDIEIRPHVDASTSFVAFLAGVVITFVATAISSWRVSRVDIVSATRGEPTTERRGVLASSGVITLAGAVIVWSRWGESNGPMADRHPITIPVELTLLIVSCCLLVLAAAGRHHGAIGTIIGLISGIGITSVWLRAIDALDGGRGELREDALVVAVGGVAVLIGICWTTMRGLPPLLRLADRLLSPFGRVRAVVRPAAGQLIWQRWRTSLVVVMFGMVVFIMAASLTLIEALLTAYADSEAPVAGFELRAQIGGDARLADLPAALVDAEAASPGDFDAIGSVRQLDTQIVQLDTDDATWRGAPLAALDEGFLDASQVRLMRRSSNYGDDPDVWRTLASTPGTAVISPALLRSVIAAPLAADDEAFDPITIWVRTSTGTASSASPIRLTVVGVIDSRSDLPPAIYTSVETASGSGNLLPAPDTWYLSLAQGREIDAIEEGLEISFDAHGIVVTNLGDALRIGQSVRTLLTRLVQGFMGLGLLAGIAALGLIGVQGVVERRRELGTLRALGLTARQIGASLAVESITIAALGIGLGIALGLLLGRSLIALLAVANPEIVFRAPWSQIIVTAGIAWVGAAAAIALAAWQASRVAPSDAMRGTT